jgi:hypothetical protein
VLFLLLSLDTHLNYSDCPTPSPYVKVYLWMPIYMWNSM